MQRQIDVEIVRRRLSYDPSTGIFIWIIPQINRPERKGTIAGTILNTGYRSIGICGIHFQAHRLAWLYTFGHFPPGEIDHINGCKDDNRIVNLREATRFQNTCNRKTGTNNKSGSKGVAWHKLHSKWAATISVNAQRFHLGYFDNIEDAKAAYAAASARLHGEFARAA